MRIGELAARTGVSTRALRYYEQQGLLRSRRRANGYREYDSTAVLRVGNIRSLLASGLTSEDIRELADCLDRDLGHEPECAEAIALFEQRLRHVRGRLDELTDVHARLEEHLGDMRARIRHQAPSPPASTRTREEETTGEGSPLPARARSAGDTGSLGDEFGRAQA
ncbi:MerR family transcriptional regulator [Marinactinospora thermotolerans]|uniref:DNA-binding transcriptional regulator, MerR family n=1 Tax=Marinactinospora thermotolerans DSM 45154 TaxID=1122192 RepID=A0A1T4LWA1_9ACTN|nr:DNA-binding transcriptional regulator, MerR family [Marinactinospora thermotolerans DSM 45154]